MLDAYRTAHDEMYLAFVKSMREVKKLRLQLAAEFTRPLLVQVLETASILTDLGQAIYHTYRDEGVLRVVVEHDEMIETMIHQLATHDEIHGADHAGAN